ncbi:MAG: hypothetical protein ACREYF_18710 [Gammaproteobacteria bacterium]
MHELHEGRWQQALRDIATPIPVQRLAEVNAGEIQQVETVEHRGYVPVHRGVVVIENGNDREYYRQSIKHTDFSLAEITL